MGINTSYLCGVGIKGVNERTHVRVGRGQGHAQEALSKCQLQFLLCKIEYDKCDERYKVSWSVRKEEMHKVGGVRKVLLKKAHLKWT